MPACEHTKTEFLMHRDGVDYLRCLDCDQVFEADDLELEPAVVDDEADAPIHFPRQPHQHHHRKAS